jgi:hemerythrin
MINKPNTLPLVSVDTMNALHLEEAALVNTLLEQLVNDADFEAVSESMKTLFGHMQQHFASEEKLMQEARYSSFRMHKAEHDKVLNEARYAAMEWRSRKNAEALREYLEDDVVTWLELHIKAMDTPMADFVSQWEKYKSY